MAEQVQCPNCGGYRVTTQASLIDKQSGAHVPPPGGACFLIAFGVIGVLAGGITLILTGLAYPTGVWSTS